MNIKPEFSLVFEKLKPILQPYSQKLIVKADTVDNFSLDGAYSQKWKKELFFGATQVRKNYVSFYLMPVYMYPDLLENVSPELRKHMQGKSCFNFKKIEPALFDELAQLTRQAYERFAQEEYTQDQ